MSLHKGPSFPSCLRLTQTQRAFTNVFTSGRQYNAVFPRDKDSLLFKPPRNPQSITMPRTVAAWNGRDLLSEINLSITYGATNGNITSPYSVVVIKNSINTDEKLITYCITRIIHAVGQSLPPTSSFALCSFVLKHPSTTIAQIPCMHRNGRERSIVSHFRLHADVCQ